MPDDHHTHALVVAYDGAHFSGFQTQPNQETVQDRLEDALSTVLGRTVRTTCAGRTDAGVHAYGQVVSFEARTDDPPADTLARSLNGLAGPHVVVREVRRARDGFSARYDATGRVYRYRLVAGPTPPLFLADRAWWVKATLDTEAMQAGAEALVGEHDFVSFCVTESAKLQTTTREVTRVEISSENVLGEDCLTIEVAGRSFLHSMVRVIVGTLVEVGKGRQEPAWVASVLAACDRTAAGPTAPPRGLVLQQVEYPEDVWS